MHTQKQLFNGHPAEIHESRYLSWELKRQAGARRQRTENIRIALASEREARKNTDAVQKMTAWAGRGGASSARAQRARKAQRS